MLAILVFLFGKREVSGKKEVSGTGGSQGDGRRRPGIQEIIRGPGLFAAGILSSLIILAVAFYLARMDLGEVWRFTFTDNFKKGNFSDPGFEWKLEHFTNSFFHTELILFYPLLLAYFLIKRRIDLVVVWLLGGCACICKIGLYEAAHFKDILPPLSLAGALSIDPILGRYDLSFKKALAIVWVCWFPKSTEPLLFVRGLIHPLVATPESYCNPPYSPLDNYSRKRLGLWIRENTGAHDKVYVANHGASILVYSERVCPSIYFNTNETEDAKRTFYKEMDSDNPELVAIPLNADYSRDVSAEQRRYLANLVADRYRTDTCLYGYTIYRLNKRR